MEAATAGGGDGCDGRPAGDGGLGSRQSVIGVVEGLGGGWWSVGGEDRRKGEQEGGAARFF